MKSEIRLSTICSRERAPKQLDCACMFDAPHSKIWKKNINSNNDIFYFLKIKQKLPMQKHMPENYIYARVFETLEWFHCPRHTICARERTPKQLQWACIPDAPHKKMKIHEKY